MLLLLLLLLLLLGWGLWWRRRPSVLVLHLFSVWVGWVGVGRADAWGLGVDDRRPPLPFYVRACVASWVVYLA